MKTVFISYSYDSDAHKEWVGKLADDLERHEDFHITLDQYDLDTYMDKSLFMEESVTTSDVVLIVATDEYKKKADGRKRGVGIETQLASQRHYMESGNTGSSNVVVVLREQNGIPNYLSSKLYIDFTDDKEYTRALGELLKSLRKQSVRKRPPKLFSSGDTVSSELTRIEDALKIIYRKRKVVIDSSEGTDYSGSNRIKFELWEVKAPKTEHILILYDHIIIKQTLERAFALIESKNISISSLTTIRVGGITTANFEAEIKKRIPSLNLSQYTLKGFIREFCIDSDLTAGHTVWEEPYFIDQPIYQSETGEESKLDDHAIPYLLDMVKSPTSCSAHLIMAEGGDGKSSLCSSLVNVINNSKLNISKSAVLLRIDEIREKISIDVANNFRINSVYDVYDLFSLLFGKGDESTNYPKVSKNEFEISVFCGDLVVVIDGLDELYSVFQDRFDKDSFLDSIQSLNDQLGESSVILTSRGNIFAENVKTLANVQVCYLRGFDRGECSEYFKKRFYNIESGEQLKRKCEDNVDGLIQATKVERISPFVVDLISNINSEHHDGLEDDNYSLQGKPYQSNTDFKDKVVFHVLRREKKRQEIHITTKELIELFCEIATEHGPSISLIKLQEVCEIFFEKQSLSVFEYLKINPLLQVCGDVIAFRYHFLHEYFITLYLIDGIINLTQNKNFINASAKYADGISASYSDVLKYFRNHKDADNFCELVKRLRSVYKRDQTAQAEKSISFIVHLMIDLKGSGTSKKDLSEEIFSCFAESSNGKNVSYLFIYLW